MSRCSKAAFLFDQLIGKGEQLVWHFETERLRGLEVDHKFELGGLTHRRLRWLLAPKNATDIETSPAIRVRAQATMKRVPQVGRSLLPSEFRNPTSGIAACCARARAAKRPTHVASFSVGVSYRTGNYDARAARRSDCGGCPKARMKARRIRSGSRNPVSCATRSIASPEDCTRWRATSIRKRSTAFDGVEPVSATKARVKCRELMPAR